MPETKCFIGGPDSPTSPMLDVTIAHWLVETTHQTRGDISSLDGARRGIRLGNTLGNLSASPPSPSSGPTASRTTPPTATPRSESRELHLLRGPPAAKPRCVDSPKDRRDRKGRQTAPKYLPNMLLQ